MSDALADLARLDAFFAAARAGSSASAVENMFWWIEAAGVPRAELVAEVLGDALFASWFAASTLTPWARRTFALICETWRQTAPAPPVEAVVHEYVFGDWCSVLRRFTDASFAVEFSALPETPSTTADGAEVELSAEACAVVARLAAGVTFAAVSDAKAAPTAGAGRTATADPHATDSDDDRIIVADTETIDREMFSASVLQEVASTVARKAAISAARFGRVDSPLTRLFFAGYWPIGLYRAAIFDECAPCPTSPPLPPTFARAPVPLTIEEIVAAMSESAETGGEGTRWNAVLFVPAAANGWWSAEAEAAERARRRRVWHDALLARYSTDFDGSAD